MTSAERKRLIDLLLEGELSQADFLRIEAELSVDPLARQEYYDRLALSTLLEVEAENSPSTESVREIIPASHPERRWQRAFAVMATAAAILVGVLSWLILSSGTGASIPSPDQPIASAPSEEQATGFAVVAGQTAARWQTGPALADGSLVPPGPLHLASGIVQLELFSGVTVVVEGEAEFAIVSPMEMTVVRGKVRAQVPEPAHGFRIRTQEGEVVDLGTDFAVEVTDGQSDIHVLDGEVEWHPRDNDMRRLDKGEALRWFADGQHVPIDANPEAFVGGVRFQEQLADSRQAKRARWQQFSDAMQRDPRLIAFYQVGASTAWSRRLPNRATAGAAGEGAVVAATRSTDRWGQPDGALDFSPTGSRVRVSVPGEYHSLTLLCWVKINSLDRWYNSLFLTDGHEIHEPHWQIMDDGRLFFSVKKRDVFDRSKGEWDKHIYYSEPFWNSTLSGQWLMIATVYDPDARLVTHYLNGQLLSQEAIPEEYLVERIHIGNASLCNWGLPTREDPHFAVRNLNGSMDEFALFSAALSADEIQELYEHGKP